MWKLTASLTNIFKFASESLESVSGRRKGDDRVFNLPLRLTKLIESGDWPAAAGPTMIAQQLHPTILAERVRQFAEDQSLICLQPPPFPTIAQLRDSGGAGDFWERFGALDQIDPECAVVIADFGIGSDSMVILDFSRDSSNPPVLRLRWGERGLGNKWEQRARDFDEFANMLGLGER